MGKAWSDATSLISGNRDTVFAVAGLFFFLPYLAMALIAPEALSPAPTQAPPGTDPQVVIDQAVAALTQQYADNWPYFLIAFFAQIIGTLSLLALLTDIGRPTVGEALQRGLISIPSYLAAQILGALAGIIVVVVPLAIVGQFAPPAAAVLLALLLAVVAVYIYVKLALVSPVIAIESELNPIKAMRQSWALTKGNSIRIFAFLMLLLIAVGVVAVLVTLILGTVFAAFSPAIAGIGNGIVTAIVNAVVGVIFIAVLASIHRQLAGPSNEATAETFE